MNRLVGLLPTGRTRKVVVLATFLVLAAAAAAIAAPSGLLTPGSGGPQGVVDVGPVNASDGFPDWYQDTNGVDLMPCNNPQDKYCGGAVNAPDNTAPISFPVSSTSGRNRSGGPTWQPKRCGQVSKKEPRPRPPSFASGRFRQASRYSDRQPPWRWIRRTGCYPAM